MILDTNDVKGGHTWYNDVLTTHIGKYRMKCS